MEESSAVRQIVVDWFAAASSGDSSIIGRYVSADPRARLVGSDPAEWLQGGADIAAFLRTEVEGSGGAAEFTPADIEAYEEGTVAWAATRLTITLPDGASVSPRWTAVFHREDDGWKFVQTHASIGVGNDQAGWVYES
ncbi:MAG: nuclear transport factor 2 family protein [Dehalococcoidia bacterium]